MMDSGRRTPRNPPATRRVEPHEHDTYRAGARPAEGTACPVCGAILRAGRWVWPGPGDEPVRPGRCPACQRSMDRYPAGVIEVVGDLGARGAELESMIRNLERSEREEHPLERVMVLERTATYLHVETTGIHLARRIAAALERQKADVELRFGEEQNFLSVRAML